MSKRKNIGSKVRTQRVYRSSTEEGYLTIPRGRMRWPSNTRARIHPKGHLKRSWIEPEAS